MQHFYGRSKVYSEKRSKWRFKIYSISLRIEVMFTDITTPQTVNIPQVNS